MNEYHKIQSVFKRDADNNYKTFLFGQYSRPEFEYLADSEWTYTEKVDGTNIRVMFDGESIAFGGKSDNAQIPKPLVKWLQDAFIPRQGLFYPLFSEGVCLYGEGYGGKIQKAGATYGPEQRFVLFDVKIGDWWLQRKDVEEIAEKFCIECVPVVGAGPLSRMIEEVREGVTSRWGDFQAEGYVARPTAELCSRNGQRIITKVKGKDFM